MSPCTRQAAPGRVPEPEALEGRGSGQAAVRTPGGSGGARPCTYIENTASYPWTHSFGNIDGAPVCRALCCVLTTQKWLTRDPLPSQGFLFLFWSVCGCSKPVALLARSRMAVTWDSVSLLRVVPLSSGLAWACSGSGWAGLQHRKQRCARPFVARRPLRHFCLLLLAEATPLEDLAASHDSRVMTSSPSPRAWRPDFPGAAREA